MKNDCLHDADGTKNGDHVLIHLFFERFSTFDNVAINAKDNHDTPTSIDVIRNDDINSKEMISLLSGIMSITVRYTL